MITVTKTFLPPIDEYQKQIQRAWDNKWLTNRGELVLELEEKLKEYLNTSNILIMTNGTIPLQIAVKLYGNQGEIITTPFSYVATTSSIIWENCKPVFVDIHPEYLSIDETKIEAAITDKTTSILATHVFGNPCNVEKIEKIAKKHNLKVIYDAAHCFGVKYDNQSIFNFGDISTCSFHATKLFHTGEGGAIFVKDKLTRDKVFYSHNFGHNGPLDFHGLGINGKISELQAAMGLAVFPYLEKIISERKKVVTIYKDKLKSKDIKMMSIRENTQWNYSYFPIIFKTEETLLKVLNELEKHNVVPRRYFYPSLNTVSFVNGEKMPVSEKIASTIMCLPLYVGLEENDINQICKVILDNV